MRQPQIAQQPNEPVFIIAMSSVSPTEPGAADRLLSTLAFVATAIILAAAIWFLIDGDGTGWILILVALLPLLAGLTLRRRSRRRR